MKYHEQKERKKKTKRMLQLLETESKYLECPGHLVLRICHTGGLVNQVAKADSCAASIASSACVREYIQEPTTHAKSYSYQYFPDSSVIRIRDQQSQSRLE